MRTNKTRPHTSSRGSAMIIVIAFTAVMAAFAAAALAYTASSSREVDRERAEVQALYSAEAGLNAGLAQFAVARNTGEDVAAGVTSADFAGDSDLGRFRSDITPNPDGTFTVQATGTAQRAHRRIEAIVAPTTPSPFNYSMFAGNFSGDSAYDLELGGTGGQADRVVGDIFSGGDIAVTGDASIDGEVTAGGTITGTAGTSGVELDLPMVLEIDYEAFSDIDVAAAFEGAEVKADNAGGTAAQLPEDHPAHIFRKDPTDRSADVNSTEKSDYFLEDPYETPTADWAQDGSGAFEVSLPAEANKRVYYIDGNLWLHNRQTYSLKITNEGSQATQVTFVVKGNVYFSDNFYYDDPEYGGVAFIALADEEVEDSGNVYFGDPSFGTMQYAEAMIFAENNFYDNNLDASGSADVRLRGSMTAGNQVAIQRDYEKSDGSVSHTRLELNFDSRQLDGVLDLPGIPREEDEEVGFVVATWREVTVPKDYVPPPFNAADTYYHDDEVGEIDLGQNDNEAPGGGQGDVADPGTDPVETIIDPETTVIDEDDDWRERWKNKPWKKKKREGKWKKKKQG